ncbi:VOC family protein [Lentilactobacillus kribbianus]|uniref:VOC family protein n=1 Tax=Lentilactobacillus kribbianus TaxID=2729622 RepID=UPI0015562C58|nr:VOC family protein [Lentilactobacillus kribbianus]
MAELIPYLMFENTKSALEYYQRVFGVTDVYRNIPTPKQADELALNVDIDLEELTMSAGFKILGHEVCCADSFLGKPVGSSLVSLMLRVELDDSTATNALEQLYQQVSNSNEVKVINSYEKRPTGNKLGQIVDKYGVTWIFNAVK